MGRLDRTGPGEHGFQLTQQTRVEDYNGMRKKRGKAKIKIVQDRGKHRYQLAQQTRAKERNSGTRLITGAPQKSHSPMTKCSAGNWAKHRYQLALQTRVEDCNSMRKKRGTFLNRTRPGQAQVPISAAKTSGRERNSGTRLITGAQQEHLYR